MKKKGNICDFTPQRDADLLNSFRRSLAECRLIDLDRIFAEVSLMPAQRFYVSEQRAALVIRRHLEKGEWPVKGQQRIRMFEEIERRTLGMLSGNPGISFDDAVFDAVNSPAPHFYLTPRTCRTLIYRMTGNRR